MASFELPRMPDTKMSPQLVMGAASPLWAYFGAAAVGGVAYWWLTRWTQTANLEAFFGAASKALPEPQAVAATAMESTVETTRVAAEVAETVVEVVAEAMPEAPVGGEAAPISPLVEAVAPEPEPAVEAAPEPVVEASPKPIAEPPADLTPEPPVTKATADPLPAPVAKPRAKKPQAPNGLEA